VFFYSVRLPSKDTENYTLQYLFQNMTGRLPGKPQNMNSSQPELNPTGLMYRTKEADQHKKELEEKPNTPNKANTDSTKLPLPALHSSTGRGKGRQTADCQS
jgi:hypothetical protein